jgi:hypothetical protein
MTRVENNLKKINSMDTIIRQIDEVKLFALVLIYFLFHTTGKPCFGERRQHYNRNDLR